MKIYLLEVQYKDKDDGLIKTLYLGTGPYTTKPTDTPASQYYEPCISAPLSFEQKVLSDGVLGGNAAGGYGTCVLINENGFFDNYRFHGFDGRLARFLVGDDSEPYSSFTVLTTCTILQPEFTRPTVTLRVRDNMELLRKEIQTTLYLGNNSAGVGFEGTADDLKDKSKPLCFGRVRNIEPALINQQKLIYQVHDGVIDYVENVYTNGNVLLRDTPANYADAASLAAAIITSGKFATCNAAGLFKLSSAANLSVVVTSDVRGDASDTGYVYKAADIIKRIVKRQAGLVDGNLLLASFTALVSAFTAETGFYVPAGGSETIEKVLEDYCRGLRVWAAFNRAGLLVVGRFSKPTGLETPVASFGPSEVYSSDFDRLPAFSLQDGQMPYMVKIKGQKNWRKHSKVEIAGAVFTNVPEYATWLSEEWREVKAQDDSVKDLHTLASVFEYESYMGILSEISTEAQAVLTTYSQELDRFSFAVKPKFTTAVNLGDIIELTIPRFGLDNGKNFVVVGMTEDYPADLVTLEVMG